MYQATHHYAFLVDVMATASNSLHSQAEELVQVVSVFKLHQPRGANAAPRNAAGALRLAR